MNGTIKKLFGEKGFGFIKDGSGAEFFFHKADVMAPTEFDELIEGDKVEFAEVVPVPSKGRRAERVNFVG